jgi:putative transposase
MKQYHLLSFDYSKKEAKYASFDRTKENNDIPRRITRDEFNADTPVTKVVTGVTEVKMPFGRVYITAFKDLFNGEILGHGISLHRTSAFVNTTLKKILPLFTEKTIVHSDRGIQYQLDSYQKLITNTGAAISMSRKASPTDNAPIESFFHILKVIMFTNRKYSSFQELSETLDRFIYFYNNHRKQKRLGYLSPVEYREKYSSLKSA